MPLRARLALLLAATLAGAAAAVATLSAGGSEPPRPPGAGFEGAVRPAIAPTELTGLVDERGRAVRLAELRGRPVVVTFLYTSCEDTCPTTAQIIRGALDDLGHDVPVLAIAVDPPRDTPARARRFLNEQRLTGRMRFLTGPREQLRRQWRAYGIQPQLPDLEHTAHVVLLDRRGVQRVGWPVSRLVEDGLEHDIAALERESA